MQILYLFPKRNVKRWSQQVLHNETQSNLTIYGIKAQGFFEYLETIESIIIESGGRQK